MYRVPWFSLYTKYYIGLEAKPARGGREKKIPRTQSQMSHRMYRIHVFSVWQQQGLSIYVLVCYSTIAIYIETQTQRHT